MKSKATTILRAAMVASLLAAFACFGVNAQNFAKAAPPPSIHTFSTENIAREGFFFAGGHYVGLPINKSWAERCIPKCWSLR